MNGEIPLWEVFIRPRNGLSHKHVGSIHAADEVMALQAARDVESVVANAVRNDQWLWEADGLLAHSLRGRCGVSRSTAEGWLYSYEDDDDTDDE